MSTFRTGSRADTRSLSLGLLDIHPTHSSTLPLTPPITPGSLPNCLPSPEVDNMASTASASVPDSPFSPVQGSTEFEQHLLALLSLISQHPSPSFPFPSKPHEGAAATSAPTDDLTLTPFDGKKSQAEDAIERAIIDLGKRVWKAERPIPNPSPEPAQPPPGSNTTTLPTPEWTPPIPPIPAQNPTTNICPTCARNPQPQYTSHPLAVSLSTPPVSRPHAQNSHSILTTSNGASVLTGGAGAVGWGVTRNVGESGMTAEKELELLKAQVQDIARVCKVCSGFGFGAKDADHGCHFLPCHLLAHSHHIALRTTLPC